MAKLHDVQRGIPHDEFVRRKARERRLDRSVALMRFVPWPRWSPPALLLLPFPGLALYFLLVSGPSAALLAPVLLAALLVVTGVWVAITDLVAFRRARRRGAPLDVGAPDEPLEGPQPRLVLIVAAWTLPTIVVGSMLTGSPLAQALSLVVLLVFLVSACTGAALVCTPARNAFVRRLRARRGERGD